MGKTVIKKKVTHHTPSERMQMRRKKRRSGPSGKRRAERRKAKQDAYAEMFKTIGTPPLEPALLDELKVSDGDT